MFAPLKAWCDSTCSIPLQAELRAFSDGKPLPNLPQLSALFCPHASAADDLLSGLVTALAAGLRDAPDREVPLRHFFNDEIALLIFLRSGSALLSVQAVQRRAVGLPVAGVFSPVEMYEHVLAGCGQVVRLDRSEDGGNAMIGQTALDVCGGTVMACIGSRQATVIARVDQPLLMLRLQRAQPGCEPAQLVDLHSGQVVQQAASNLADTRLELAAAVLGQMERRDAAPGLAAAALGLRSPAARWQALRAALALDSRAGFSALSALAGGGDDPLTVPAQELQAQLLSAWPQLRERTACR